MKEKQFISDLSSIYANLRKVDARKINLKGKNILEYIDEAKINGDTRNPELKNDELDIWNTEISLSEEGHIEVKPKEHFSLANLETGEITLEGITEFQCNTLKTAVKVIDNEVLGENDEHIMYWQTNGLTVGNEIFLESALTSFSSNLSSLTDGTIMFIMSTLTSFSSDLSSLTEGTAMFYNCSNLNSFSSELPSLTNGSRMFGGCTNLESFSSELPSLTNGYMMFNGCTNLTSFTSDLSSLPHGESMFSECANLTSFTSDLSSLIYGGNMFNLCKLDAPSVANIVHTLPPLESSKRITIGIGCDNTAEDQLLFAQECDCDTWQELLDDFSAKNWTVEFQCNGRPTTTYSMRRGETLPIYTKLEEVIMPTDEKERKPHYAYTSADGTKFYNIHYFHSTNGSTEGYDVFSSLEEAISTYNVTPKN